VLNVPLHAGSMSWLVAVLSCLVGAAFAYSNYGLAPDIAANYDDALMQDLYKRLAGIDPAYFIEQDDAELGLAPAGIDDRAAVYEASPPRPWYDDAEDDDTDVSSQLKSLPRSPVAGGQTDTRDSEYIGHSSNAGSDGFIYMSGSLPNPSNHGRTSRGMGEGCSPPPKFGQFNFLGNDKNLGRRGFWC